jgi:hypothetical protein
MHACSALRGVTLPEDVVRQEMNRTHNIQLQEQRKKRWAWSAARMAARASGEDTPSVPEVTPPPLSLPWGESSLTW